MQSIRAFFFSLGRSKLPCLASFLNSSSTFNLRGLAVPSEVVVLVPDLMSLKNGPTSSELVVFAPVLLCWRPLKEKHGTWEQKAVPKFCQETSGHFCACVVRVHDMNKGAKNVHGSNLSQSDWGICQSSVLLTHSRQKIKKRKSVSETTLLTESGNNLHRCNLCDKKHMGVDADSSTGANKVSSLLNNRFLIRK